MAFRCGSIAFVAILALGLSQAQKQAPVLKEAPKEVLFTTGKGSGIPLVLECAVESGDSAEIKSFQWYKGSPLVSIPVDPSSPVDARFKLDAAGTLRVEDPKGEDEGLYHCLATTSAGIARTSKISAKRTYLEAPKEVTTQRIKPVEGRPFKLACKIPDSYPKPIIEWQKVSADGKSETVLDGRITFSDEGDLYFTNATQHDVNSAGSKYVCVGKSKAFGDVTLAEHIVEGLEKNPKPDNEVVQLYVTPNGTTALTGNVTLLYCIYGSSPQAYPDWYKDGVNVNNSPGDRVTRHNRSKGKRLLIKHTLPEDEGDYTCVINNELGKPQNYTFHLNVVGVPEFVKNPEKRVQAKDGDELTLPCEAQARPVAQVTWTHNTKDVALSRRIVVTDKGLTIKKVQKSDSGYYGCKAFNVFGEVYAETLVQVA